MSKEQNGLPPGWELERLGAIGLVGSSRRVRQSDWRKSGIPFYRAREIVKLSKYGSVDNDLFISEELFESLSERGLVPETGDIMLTGVGTIGVPYEVKEHDHFYFKDASVLIFKNTHGLPASYLFHVFRSPSWKALIHRDSGGTTVRTLTIKQTSDIRVPLPPLNEQKRIVAKIEALQLRSEAAKEALDAIPPLLEQFRQSVLAAAFRGDLTKAWRAENPDVEPASELLARIRVERRTRWIENAAVKARDRARARAGKAGKPWSDEHDAKVLERERAKAAKKYKEPEPVDAKGLPELPEGWCWTTVETFTTKVSDGVHKKPHYVEAGVPFVTVKNLTAGPGISFERLNYITPEDHADFIRRTHPERGDVLISKDGTLGVVRYIETDVVFSIFVSVALMKPVLRDGGPHLALMLETPQVQEMLVATGSGLKHIHLRDLRATPIPVPPAAEQEEIRRVVAERLERLEGLSEIVSQWTPLVEQMHQSILSKAFRGELVPQDPYDEPASALLARIRAEREAAEATKGKKKRSRGRGRWKKPAPAVVDQPPLPGMDGKT